MKLNLFTASALLTLRGTKEKEEIKRCAEVPLPSLTLHREDTALAASHPSPWSNRQRIVLFPALHLDSNATLSRGYRERLQRPI